MTDSMPTPGRKLARHVVAELETRKAIDIVVLNVANMTTVTDFMIVATGNSNRHVKALADNLIRQAKERGTPPLGVEGQQQGEWVLVDLCDAVVHIMLPDVRDFYQLEKLWANPRERTLAGSEKKMVS